MLHAGCILRFTLVCCANQHFPHPFSRKAGMLPLRCRGKIINLSHLYSRSERFTFAAGKHFTLQSNASRRIYPALHVGLLRKPTHNFRTAGRVLQVRADRSVLEYVTGGSNAARRASENPFACWAFSPTIGANQAARNQERYRTAGRVLPRSPRGEWTCVLDPSGDDRKARSGKAISLRK
jgi:hypothetical protein